MIICQINDKGYFLTYKEIADTAPIPIGWIIASIPSGDGPFYRRVGSNWIDVPQIPDSSDVEVKEPIRFSRVEFLRLLTFKQRNEVRVREKQFAALTAEELRDPANALLAQVADVLEMFEAPDEFIELDHKDTRRGLELLAYDDVFGTDPVIAASEINRILSGKYPSE